MFYATLNLSAILAFPSELTLDIQDYQGYDFCTFYGPIVWQKWNVALQKLLVEMV